MNDPEKKPSSSGPADVSQGGFSNLDDNIRSQQEADVEQEREEDATPPPDPAGERHAPDA